MPRIQTIVVAILLMAVAASCASDSTAPQAETCSTDTTTSVEPTISVGSSVVFDWKPECAVALLIVETAGESGHDIWWISTFDPDSTAPSTVDANRIASHVTFGQVPSTATDSYGPEPLVAGQTYRFALWRIVPQSSSPRCLQSYQTACLLAVKTFTR